MISMQRPGLLLTARRAIDLARCSGARCPRWSAFSVFPRGR